MGIKRKSSGHDEVAGSSPTAQPAKDKLLQPHDKFVKCAFKNKAIAIDFFATHLAETALSREELENFSLSNSEHQQPFKPKLANDVVYHGEIADQDYYIITEHQSSFDNSIITRLLQYTLALMNEHTGQKKEGAPVVLGICLYHNTRANSTLGSKYKITLGDYFVGGVKGRHASCSQLKYKFKLVDLTALDYEEIAKHGHAAIVELFLKDASLSSDIFIAKAKGHLASDCYKRLSDKSFDEFKSALYEYILSLSEEPTGELVETLAGIVPEEREIMLTAAEQLRQEGRVKGRLEGILEGRQEVAREMLTEHYDPQLIKKFTHLSDDELAQLSPEGRGSASPRHKRKGSQSLSRLVQNISGVPESAEGGEVGTTTVDNPETTGTISPPHKKFEKL